MPELPEVETTRRGLAAHLVGQIIAEVRIRQPRLRWPVSPQLPSELPGQRILGVERRAKYLLLRLQQGTLILHLGMSGSLRVLSDDIPPQPHDHFDLVLTDGHCLRLRDPRRFGAVLWTRDPPEAHPLLRQLGPEPLGPEFSGRHLHQHARSRRCPVKSLIMDQRVVVGIGNIYANESLFAAGIHPLRACQRVSPARYQRLAEAIRRVLGAAIAAGGTTLRDFQQQDGRPGYFYQELRVYARAGEPCRVCRRTIRQRRIGQRSSYYCPGCQH